MVRDLTLETAFTLSGQLTQSLPPSEYSVNITQYDRFSNCYVMRDGVPASSSFLSFSSRKSINVRNTAIFSDLNRPSHRNRFLWSESSSPSTENALLPPPWRLKPEPLKNFQNISVKISTCKALQQWSYILRVRNSTIQNGCWLRIHSA
jgi:hypothetical protein